MGKKVGDVVEVEAPGGNYTVEVLEKYYNRLSLKWIICLCPLFFFFT